MIGAGDLDFTVLFAGAAVAYVDAGVPLVTVVGLHPGCFELFAHEPIRTISDLRGRRVVIDVRGAGKHVYMSVMAAHIGLDPSATSNGLRGQPWGPTPPLQSSCSSTATSTRSSVFRPNRSDCVGAMSGV